jgi:hypothetical protein
MFSIKSIVSSIRVAHNKSGNLVKGTGCIPIRQDLFGRIVMRPILGSVFTVCRYSHEQLIDFVDMRVIIHIEGTHHFLLLWTSSSLVYIIDKANKKG